MLKYRTPNLHFKGCGSILLSKISLILCLSTLLLPRTTTYPTYAAGSDRKLETTSSITPYPHPAYPHKTSSNDKFCPPLPTPTNPIITVSTESELRQLAHDAAPGTTILIKPGRYNLSSLIHIVNKDISLRGSTGNRDDVILDFGGKSSDNFGILVEADDITIADLTIRNSSDHGISIQGVDRPTLYNLHVLDTFDQLIKVNPAADGSEDGLLACSRLEYTTTAPDDYTNGISAHQAHRWVVRDNQWYRIRGVNSTTGPTILFWSGSTDTIVERNLIVDSYRGIAFGNPSHNDIDHTGGIVRNNMIYFSQAHDVAIEMIHAQGWLVAYNTALLSNPSTGLTWGMEARFMDSQGTFAYNLTNMPIWADRDGAQGVVTGNLTSAQPSWFVDPQIADLHLRATTVKAIDQGSSMPQVIADYDGDIRPIGTAPDIGADEFSTIILPVSAVTDLQISGFLIPDALHATLTWTAPPEAVTTTLRYTYTHITESNWEAAYLLTDSLPGNTGTYQTNIPIINQSVFVALKTRDTEGAWSPLSNNALWPQQKTWLPLIFKDDNP